MTKLEIGKYQTKAYLTLMELGMVLDLVRDDFPSECKYIHVHEHYTVFYRSCP